MSASTTSLFASILLLSTLLVVWEYEQLKARRNKVDSKWSLAYQPETHHGAAADLFGFISWLSAKPSEMVINADDDMYEPNYDQVDEVDHHHQKWKKQTLADIPDLNPNPIDSRRATASERNYTTEFDLGPGPISNMLPGGPRKPGTVDCLHVTSERTMGVMNCGTYSRIFDRSLDRFIPTSTFSWTTATHQIVLEKENESSISHTDRSMCLAAGSNRKIVLQECDTNSDDQKWDISRRGGIHKDFTMIKHRYTSSCLSIVKDKFRSSPSLQDCNQDSCSQVLSFTDNVSISRSHQDHRIRGNVPHAYSETNSNPTKILCWILTYPKAHNVKAVAINATWGRHCDKLLFMTTENYEGLNTIVLNIGGPEDRGRLWNKSREAWTYVYNNDLESYDWFIKADDDTYIVWKNLLTFLDDKNPESERYFGRKFNATRGEYYGGGSGIILSRGALRKVKEAAEKDYWGTWSTKKVGPEDLQTGQVMTRVGIHTETLTDRSGGHLFLPLGPHFEYRMKAANPEFWFYRISVASKVGEACCSKQWIATHYASPPQLYLLDDYEDTGCLADTTTWPHLEAPKWTGALDWK